MMLMQLHEQGLLDLTKTVADYLPDTKGTNIAGLKMQDILTHQSGLPAWVPFYKKHYWQMALRIPDITVRQKLPDILHLLLIIYTCVMIIRIPSGKNKRYYTERKKINTFTAI